MKKERQIINGMEIDIYHVHTVVAGSGAAGLAAAVELYDHRVKDICIVTEHIRSGTSRNTGSDKQTYYKLGLCGRMADSTYQMAETLFQGGCMDGELALTEAALSAECFLNLVNIGVPFPHNRYGEYVGYKTDHDPMQRASSAGPLTSRYMTEHLQKEVEKRNIKIFSGWQIIRVLQDQEKVYGVLCIKSNAKKDNTVEYRIFQAKNIVYATGGPAVIYKNSVYPKCQHGASGIAYMAGAKGRNLTEWQYGMASVNPRWNVSGTYMQVLPRFVSTDQEGKDEKEFLGNYFSSKEEIVVNIFLKGYQWPFDVRKSKKGSSRIDLAVYEETIEKNRKVYLDFGNNPWYQPITSWKLPNEIDTYLKSANAYCGTPWERLKQMNQPAYDFYLKRGIDLKEKYLEISMCAQHNNGGIAVDLWWKSNLSGLFVIGEAAGTHGVYRPGGAALNAGQVGAKRAAVYIASRNAEKLKEKDILPENCWKQIHNAIEITKSAEMNGDGKTAEEWIEYFSSKMSEVGGIIRREKEMEKLLFQCEELIQNFDKSIRYKKNEIQKVYLLEDLLYTQKVYLSAMLNYIKQNGCDRGSAIYKRKTDDAQILRDLSDQIQEIKINRDGSLEIDWRNVFALPEDDNFFEKVWKGYRKNRNIY